MTGETRKKVMTSFDLMAITRELNQTIQGKIIDNIYQINPRLFLIKLRPGDLQLLIELERRVHLTKYVLHSPKIPPQLCMELRKNIRGGRIRGISQQGLERVIQIELTSWKGELTLVIEVFKRGNLILLGQDNKIICASKYAVMRDRSIRRREYFKPIKSSGLHPEKVDIKDVIRPDTLNQTISKALLDLLPFPPIYIKECLLSLGINEKIEVGEIHENDVEKLMRKIKEIYRQQYNESNPVIVSINNVQIDVLPLPLHIYEEYKVQPFSSFNEASDEYFSQIYLSDLGKSVRSPQESRIEEFKRIIEYQVKEKEKYEKQIKSNNEIANIISKNILSIDTIIKKINLVKTNDFKKVIDGERILQISPKNKMAETSVNERNFGIRYDKSAYWNVGSYFDKSKRFKKKLQGLNTSLEKNIEQLKSLQIERIKKEEEQPSTPTLKVKKKKEWYEKFRWFTSSNGFMVLIGKDASTNRLLIEKYTSSEDLVLHADIVGAPFVVIKTEGRIPDDETIRESSIAAASYSKAWANGFSSCDIYWVKSNQLSKKPPSGEYIKRGMYMIYGRRNYLRSVSLGLSIGCKYDGQIEIIGGPTSAVKQQTPLFVEIIPGDLGSGKLAKKILEVFIRKSPEKLKNQISRIELNTIQIFIPSGKGDIKT